MPSILPGPPGDGWRFSDVTVAACCGGVPWLRPRG
jgi:hypothetical protein